MHEILWNIQPFNRTSLELKHGFLSLLGKPKQAFNRTSLELKRDADQEGETPRTKLLIAPVWNWNPGVPDETEEEVMSFNRTSLELKLACNSVHHTRCKLLIAPVWNWNSCSPNKAHKPPVAFNRTSLELKRWNGTMIMLPLLTFNRTSLELKLCTFWNFRICSACLLIAPVWNWNSGWCRSIPVWETSFNRTSLELKRWRARERTARLGCHF